MEVQESQRSGQDGNAGQSSKRPSVRRLFVERMKREGREKAWYATLHRVMQESGKRYGQAVWPAMKLMGYAGPKREHELHEQFLREAQKTKLQRQ